MGVWSYPRAFRWVTVWRVNRPQKIADFSEWSQAGCEQKLSFQKNEMWFFIQGIPGESGSRFFFRSFRAGGSRSLLEVPDHRSGSVDSVLPVNKPGRGRLVTMRFLLSQTATLPLIVMSRMIVITGSQVLASGDVNDWIVANRTPSRYAGDGKELFLGRRSWPTHSE